MKEILTNILMQYKKKSFPELMISCWILYSLSKKFP